MIQAGSRSINKVNIWVVKSAVEEIRSRSRNKNQKCFTKLCKSNPSANIMLKCHFTLHRINAMADTQVTEVCFFVPYIIVLHELMTLKYIIYCQ